MITLVLMASGYGKRFGSNKLFFEIDGKAMYLHILEKMHRLSEKEICGHIVRPVVITQYSEIMETAEKYGMDAVFNPDASEGIAASVRLGAKAAEDSDWVVYLTADQPYLEIGTIEGFISAAIRSGKALASVCCGSEPGSPTMFQMCRYPALLQLKGDRGGRVILKSHPSEVFRYEISAREITDIDYSDML